MIVLEDLSVNGFTTLHAPDYETSKMIFQRLAVFHAASFYLLENVRKSISQETEILFFSTFSLLISSCRREPITRASTIQFTICQTPFKSASSDTT